jgi:hypothetical protein
LLLEHGSFLKQMLVTYLIDSRTGYHQLVFIFAEVPISSIASLVVPS